MNPHSKNPTLSNPKHFKNYTFLVLGMSPIEQYPDQSTDINIHHQKRRQSRKIGRGEKQQPPSDVNSR